MIESRGGADGGPTATRNRDYQPAVSLLLTRMAMLGATLREVLIASNRTVALPRAERVLEMQAYDLPLKLSIVRDFDHLRTAIGRAGAAFGRLPGENAGGNYTKRICLCLDWSEAERPALERLAILLAGRAGEAGGSALLAARVGAEQHKIRGQMGEPPSTGTDKPEVVPGAASRFVRRPDVIAWVLVAADGVCEACNEVAPFFRNDGEPYLEVHHVRPLGRWRTRHDRQCSCALPELSSRDSSWRVMRGVEAWGAEQKSATS